MTEDIKVFPESLRRSRPDADADIRPAVAEIETAGYTVLPGQLSVAECDALKAAARHLYRQEVEEFGGAELIRQIGDEGVARSPFLRDERFIAPMMLPKVLKITHHILGPQIHMNVQRVVMGMPGKPHGAGVWHRDHSYQDFTTSHAVSLTAIVMLDGSNPDNGGIFVIPGSHRGERFPSDQDVRNRAVPVNCETGALVLMDSALFHRNSVNTTKTTRHSIVSIYTIPLIRQNIDYPRALGGKFQDDAILSMLFGYDSAVPVGDLEYRRTKLQRGQKIGGNY